MRKFLFVTHEASRSGAPWSLLTFLEWLSKDRDIEIEVAVLEDGPLRDRFDRCGHVIFAPIANDGLPPAEGLAARIPVARRANRLYRQSQLKKHFRSRGYDCVVLNSLGAYGFVAYRDEFSCPWILYVREMGIWMQQHLSREKMTRLDAAVSGYMATSRLVRDDLANQYGVSASRIEVVNPFVAIPDDAGKDAQAVRTQLCAEFGIPKDAFLVIGCGSVAFFKGADLFVRLAEEVRRRNLSRPVHWVWLGYDSREGTAAYIKNDVRALGLDPYVHFLGSVDNPLAYLSAADVYAMVSRTEAFGRVVLEAASMGTPTICFDKYCGATDFVAEECGVVVPYLDIEAFSDTIVAFSRDPQECARLGKNAKERFFAYHTVEQGGPKFLHAIEKWTRQS